MVQQKRKVIRLFEGLAGSPCASSTAIESQKRQERRLRAQAREQERRLRDRIAELKTELAEQLAQLQRLVGEGFHLDEDDEQKIINGSFVLLEETTALQLRVTELADQKVRLSHAIGYLQEQKIYRRELERIRAFVEGVKKNLDECDLSEDERQAIADIEITDDLLVAVHRVEQQHLERALMNVGKEPPVTRPFSGGNDADKFSTLSDKKHDQRRVTPKGAGGVEDLEDDAGGTIRGTGTEHLSGSCLGSAKYDFENRKHEYAWETGVGLNDHEHPRNTYIFRFEIPNEEGEPQELFVCGLCGDFREPTYVGRAGICRHVDEQHASQLDELKAFRRWLTKHVDPSLKQLEKFWKMKSDRKKTAEQKRRAQKNAIPILARLTMEKKEAA